MDFPNYSNIFSSGKAAFNPSSYSGSYNLGSSKGSSMFPWMAAATLGSSVIEGIVGGQAASRQAEAQLTAAKWQAEATRDAAFNNLLAGQYAQTGAKQFDQFLQRNAANYQQAFLDPRKSMLASEERQRGFADQLSPKAQQLRFQQNADQLNRNLSAQRAITDAMFGRVAEAPFAYGQVPGYAAFS